MSAIDTIKEAHELATNFTLLLVAGHLLGVVWETFCTARTSFVR
jgi:cytochrome b561